MTVLIVWILCELMIAVGRPSVREAVNTIDPAKYIEPYREKIEKLIQGRTHFMIFSRELGWTHKAWGRHGLDNANGQGIRSDEDYSLHAASGVLRLATFGGSFVYGADVDCGETWQAMMEKDHSGVEALNFGVSAYGTDQALLRYRLEGMAFDPDVVVLGFINENRLRNFSTFRPFYHPSTGLPLGKPRFLLKDGGLVLVPNPFQSLEDYRRLLEDPAKELPRIGAEDSYYAQYESKRIPFVEQLPSISALRFWIKRISESRQELREGNESEVEWAENFRRHSLLLHLFDAFVADARSHGAKPLIMLCPISFDYQDGDGIHADPYPQLKRYFRARGVNFLDLEEVFEPYLSGGGQVADLFAFGERGGHYSALAHRLIEEGMLERIEKLRREDFQR